LKIQSEIFATSSRSGDTKLTGEKILTQPVPSSTFCLQYSSLSTN